MTIYATRDTIDSLRLTPRPVEPDVSLVADDLYCITTPDGSMGFIEKAGNVFVALSGTAYDQALEVGQSLSWDQAVFMLQQASAASPGIDDLLALRTGVFSTQHSSHRAI